LILAIDKNTSTPFAMWLRFSTSIPCTSFVGLRARLGKKMGTISLSAF